MYINKDTLDIMRIFFSNSVYKIIRSCKIKDNNIDVYIDNQMYFILQEIFITNEWNKEKYNKK